MSPLNKFIIGAEISGDSSVYIHVHNVCNCHESLIYTVDSSICAGVLTVGVLPLCSSSI